MLGPANWMKENSITEKPNTAINSNTEFGPDRILEFFMLGMDSCFIKIKGDRIRTGLPCAGHADSK
jgi:hypothetical protein